MNKKEILQSIIASLEQDLRVVTDATRAAYEAATHEESRPEDQYDTRGVEASYLASAQSQRATDLERMIVGLKNFLLKPFSDSDAIATGALIELEQDDKTLWIFLLPSGAGISVPFDGKQIAVVTPASPLGQELVDRKCGDGFSLKAKGASKEYNITKVY